MEQEKEQEKQQEKEQEKEQEKQQEKEQEKQQEKQQEKKKGKAGVVRVILALLFIAAGAAVLIWRYVMPQEKISYQGKPWYQEAAAPSRAELPGEVAKLPVQTPADDQPQRKTDSLAQAWVYGNDMQIYARGAEVAVDGNCYYVADRTEGGLLYRVTKEEPKQEESGPEDSEKEEAEKKESEKKDSAQKKSEQKESEKKDSEQKDSGQTDSYRKEKLTDIPVSQISVQGSKLYFASDFANASGDRGIYEMNTDGSGLQRLSEASPREMILVNDWLYYLDGRDLHIYKMNVSERAQIRLTEKLCSSMSIHENVIYFSCGKEDGGSALAAMDVNGENYRELAVGEEFDHVMYADGKIYVVSESEECISCMDPDGKNARVIKKAAAGSGVQICDGAYYYIDAGHGSSLAVYREKEEESGQEEAQAAGQEAGNETDKEADKKAEEADKKADKETDKKAEEADKKVDKETDKKAEEADKKTDKETEKKTETEADKKADKETETKEPEEEKAQYFSVENVLDLLVFDRMLYLRYLEGTEEKVSVYRLDDCSRVPFFEKPSE